MTLLESIGGAVLFAEAVFLLAGVGTDARGMWGAIALAGLVAGVLAGVFAWLMVYA